MERGRWGYPSESGLVQDQVDRLAKARIVILKYIVDIKRK